MHAWPQIASSTHSYIPGRFQRRSGRASTMGLVAFFGPSAEYQHRTMIAVGTRGHLGALARAKPVSPAPRVSSSISGHDLCSFSNTFNMVRPAAARGEQQQQTCVNHIVWYICRASKFVGTGGARSALVVPLAQQMSWQFLRTYWNGDWPAFSLLYQFVRLDAPSLDI